MEGLVAPQLLSAQPPPLRGTLRTAQGTHTTTQQQHAAPLLMPTVVVQMASTGVCRVVMMGTSSAMPMEAVLRASTGLLLAAAVACRPRRQSRPRLPKCSHSPHSPHLALPCPRRDSPLKVVAASWSWPPLAVVLSDAPLARRCPPRFYCREGIVKGMVLLWELPLFTQGWWWWGGALNRAYDFLQ